MSKIQRALISVSDKTGIAALAQSLHELGTELLSTGGTHKAIAEAGVPVREVSEYTGFPEMMNGRVKTLHPMVHGGILALRDEASHVVAMEAHGIGRIDLVVVNLYPFEETVAKEGVSRADAVEQIDIGGPSMMRSAAKNHRHVAILTDPADYGRAIEEMQSSEGVISEEFRRELAAKAFALTARYDTAISGWLHGQEVADERTKTRWPESYATAGVKQMELRYGENPHQTAAFYTTTPTGEPSVATAEVLNGKALSYNNLVDLDAAHNLAKEFIEPFVAVTKHNNPCGAAVAETVGEALEMAWAGDPISAFGSVLAFTRPVDLASATFLVEGNRFVEAIIAPSFDEDAFALLTTKPKWGRSVRLLACGPYGPDTRSGADIEFKKLAGGFLLQDRDLEISGDWTVATKKKPTPEEEVSLRFAEKVGKHVKSNSIIFCKGTRVAGVGAGQMSRVDSVHLAARKAGDEAQGCVLASDAFFPFPDGVEAAIEAGATAILQPGGSVRDAEVVAACDRLGATMVFTGQRHFRH